MISFDIFKKFGSSLSLKISPTTGGKSFSILSHEQKIHWNTFDTYKAHWMQHSVIVIDNFIVFDIFVSHFALMLETALNVKSYTLIRRFLIN